MTPFRTTLFTLARPSRHCCDARLLIQADRFRIIARDQEVGHFKIGQAQKEKKEEGNIKGKKPLRKLYNQPALIPLGIECYTKGGALCFDFFARSFSFWFGAVVQRKNRRHLKESSYILCRVYVPIRTNIAADSKADEQTLLLYELDEWLARSVDPMTACVAKRGSRVTEEQTLPITLV